MWKLGTYRRRDKFTDPVKDILKSFLSILELGEEGSQESFRTIHIMLRGIMTVHAVLMIWVALNIEDMPLQKLQ